LSQALVRCMLPVQAVQGILWQDSQNEVENMNVEKDKQLKKRFRRVSLVVSPVTGIIAAIIAAACRTDMRNQVAFLFLTFCLAMLVAILVIRAIGWVVRRSVAGDADKKENAVNEKDRQ